MDERSYDVVLYGATGFVGRQVVRYFAEFVDPGATRWAIAGRDRRKLEEVRDSLNHPLQSVGILVARSEDAAGLRTLAASTRVVLNTAGPFALYGESVVAACLAQGTDYVDISGETPYVRRLIDTYHQQATERQVRIIPFCGFDSVPSDLGTLLVVDLTRRTLGQPCQEVKGVFSSRGGVNGGTLASVYRMFDAGGYAEFRDPGILDPESDRAAVDRWHQRDPVLPHYDEDARCWLAPFFMAPINTRVVRRSHALMSAWGAGYGPNFSYDEYMQVGHFLGAAQAYAVSTALTLGTGLLRRRATRSLLKRWSPEPGSGPSEKVMRNGFFRLRLVAKTEDGRRIGALLADRGDPGNRVTAKIVSESALCLAQEREALPGGPERGGILTPATGLGLPLLERLRRAGMRVEVEESLERC